MAIDSNDNEERQAHLDAMIEEFRAAQQRRFVKVGMARWTRTESAQQAVACVRPVPRDKAQ